MDIADPNIKELNGIKILLKSPDEKDYKYFSITRWLGVHPIKKGNDFYMMHHFCKEKLRWFTYKIREI